MPTTAEIAATISECPAWAKIGLTMPVERLREDAALEMARHLHSALYAAPVRMRGNSPCRWRKRWSKRPAISPTSAKRAGRSGLNAPAVTGWRCSLHSSFWRTGGVRAGIALGLTSLGTSFADARKVVGSARRSSHGR